MIIDVGVKGIMVELVEYPRNAYRPLVNMAMATWEYGEDSWRDMLPIDRFDIALRVLSNNALPLGRENISFLFRISNLSRASFDQIARQRIGATFASLSSCYVHDDTNIRLPNEIGNKHYKDIADLIDKVKDKYLSMVKEGISPQSARMILPIGLEHSFYFSITLEALMAFCKRRLCFSEQEDTVAVAWLMREQVRAKYPFIASFLRPACDFAGRCVYSSRKSMASDMGTLFKPCGRNKVVDAGICGYPVSSSTSSTISEQCSIHIPGKDDDRHISMLDELSDLDKELFYDCDKK